MPPLKIVKAYVRQLRTDTYANLIGKLKDGESGLVVGGDRVIINDNGTYREFALSKGTNGLNPIFENSYVDGATSAFTDGGPLGTPTSKVFSTFSGKGFVVLSPATAITSYWTLVVPTVSYYKIRVRNGGVVTAHLTTNISTGDTIAIEPNTIVNLVYFNNKWWPETIPQGEVKTFVPVFNDFAAPLSVVATYKIVSGVVYLHMTNAVGASSDRLFQISNIPSEIQPSRSMVIGGLALTEDGGDVQGVISIPASSSTWSFEWWTGFGLDNIFTDGGVSKGISRQFQISYLL